MTTPWSRSGTRAGIAALMIAGCAPVPTPFEPDHTQQQIATLIELLGARDVAARGKAADELIELGDLAIAALDVAARRGPTAFEARRVLRRIRLVRFTPDASVTFSLRTRELLGSRTCEPAVRSALAWLVRHQARDGSWGAEDPVGQCGQPPCVACHHAGDEWTTGMTGLAALALLGAGIGPDPRDESGLGIALRQALSWLARNQARNGCLDTRSTEPLTGHAIATLAMVEAPGDEWIEPARRALAFLVSAQGTNKGWGYHPKSETPNTAVTAWAVLALVIARDAGFSVEPDVSWFDRVMETDYYRVGYDAKFSGRVFLSADPRRWRHHETMTAAAVTGRLLAGRSRHAVETRHAVPLMLRDLPAWEGDATDFFYWHWGSLGLHQNCDPVSEEWRTWNGRVRSVLLAHQETTGCAAGSWAPCDRWSIEGGRVYATAINALTLETPTRYARMK